MRAPIIIAALMATAKSLQPASGVSAAGDAIAPATNPVRPDACSARDAPAARCDATHATARRRFRALAQHRWHRGSRTVRRCLQGRAHAPRRPVALGGALVCTEWRIRCAYVLLRAMPGRTSRIMLPTLVPLRSGVAAPDRASAPCALSDGRDASWGDFFCACVDCGGGGSCEQHGWSAACDGDAPCRAPDGSVGTMQGGRACATRKGAAGSVEQLCLPGSAAPHAGS